MRAQSDIEKTALRVTRAVGSPPAIIAHSIFFLGCFALAFWGVVDFDRMLLVLTTIVSLEAIYLAIFIQMTINYQSQSLAEVSQDVEEIQEDVEEISEDVGEIQEDVEELQEDIEEISEDVEEISEDVEDISEEDVRKAQNHALRSEALASIQTDLRKLMDDIEKLKK